MRGGFLLTVTLLFLAMAGSAMAGGDEPEGDPRGDDAEWNPPARFDHPYTGKLTIKYLPMSRVQLVCERYKAFDDQVMYGCASWDSTSCIIVVIDHQYLNQTPQALIRHEMGHCNGWGADHPD
ncbi:hypothetical protein FJ973_29605 [Mesorhizobium sp. B2-1-3]|nr:hypothetical protein FJ973_29605 [Mesorhizobium sp. B2-1-3]